MRNVRVKPWYKPRPPEERELKELLLKECLKPRIDILEPHEMEEVHAHPHDEIHMVLKGKVEFCVEGRCRVLKPGDRIDISKATPHTIKPLSNGVVLVSATRK